LTASESPWRLLSHAAVAACLLVGCAGTGTAGAGQICHVHDTGSDYTVNFDFPVSHPDQQALRHPRHPVAAEERLAV